MSVKLTWKATTCKGILHLFGFLRFLLVKCTLLSSQCMDCLQEGASGSLQVVWFADLKSIVCSEESHQSPVALVK